MEELLAIEVYCMSFYFQWANDVFVVLDLMIYDIDLLLELVGLEVVKLFVSGSWVFGLGYLDYVIVMLGFFFGIVVIFIVSKVIYCKICFIVVYCKNFFIEVDFFNNEILIYC